MSGPDCPTGKANCGKRGQRREPRAEGVLGNLVWKPCPELLADHPPLPRLLGLFGHYCFCERQLWASGFL